jgi:hypothetical protein
MLKPLERISMILSLFLWSTGRKFVLSHNSIAPTLHGNARVDYWYFKSLGMESSSNSKRNQFIVLVVTIANAMSHVLSFLLQFSFTFLFQLLVHVFVCIRYNIQPSIILLVAVELHATLMAMTLAGWKEQWGGVIAKTTLIRKRDRILCPVIGFLLSTHQCEGKLKAQHSLQVTCLRSFS